MTAALAVAPIVLHREAWSTAVEGALGALLGDDRAQVLAEIAEGRAELWRIEGHGYAITRIEVYPDHRELVIVAAVGEKVREAAAAFAAWADANGIDRIRFHTARPALGRLLAPLGFELSEYVFVRRRP
jgi:hypothetical protein